MQPWRRAAASLGARGRKGIGGLLLAAAGQGWQGRAGSSRLAHQSPPPPPTPPPSCLAARLPSLRGPGARLCTFHPWPSGLGGRSCAVVPGDPSRPGATRPEGLRLPLAGTGPAPALAGDLGAALAAGSPGSASLRRARDPGPHAVPREAKGDLGSGSPQLGKELALKFRGCFSFLVGDPLLVRL